MHQGWELLRNSIYTGHMNQAFNMCRTDGGNLVIIESSEEQEFIAGLMQKRIFTAVELCIGSNKVHPEEDRRWINGEKFSYANWAKADLSSNESEQCIKDQNTGHCYQIVDKKTIWNQAYNICMQDGGMLVVIESSEEQKFIEVLMQRINFTVDGLWMGSNRLHPEKQRAWINRKKFIYANWAEGEPNNEPLIENCAEINTSDSSWNDCDCTYRRGYICETKSPGTSEKQSWVIGVAVASALVLFVGMVLLCCLIYKRQKTKNEKRDEVYQEVQEMEINNIGHGYGQAADVSDTYCTIDGDYVSPDETHRKVIY
ncbi:hypothetical protein ACJMK2_022572 [Sinanodonta woodiana]|uniref:C-type lectin domain-containing protein n=1 Tax=Sinanodonta woodiana TaxID=1069815 RepID=A0ABD3TJH3_SINWO